MTTDIDKVISALKEREKYYLDHYLPLENFLDEVVIELSKFTINDYELIDIFSKDTIEQDVLEHSLPYLQAGAGGGKVTSIISSCPGGAQTIDHSDKIPAYIKVFEEWRQDNLVSIEYHHENKDIPIAIKFNKNLFGST